MQAREIAIRDFENTFNDVEKVNEPIIVKRANKEDLVVISLEEYQKVVFNNKFNKSKEQYKEGKVHKAKTVFKGLRERYGY